MDTANPLSPNVLTKIEVNTVDNIIFTSVLPISIVVRNLEGLDNSLWRYLISLFCLCNLLIFIESKDTKAVSLPENRAERNKSKPINISSCSISNSDQRLKTKDKRLKI